MKSGFGSGDFVSEYNAFRGTSLGLVHTLRQSAVFRTGHRSMRVEDFYYTEQYSHPGIGL